jgi:hypothetical protein
MLMFRAMTMKAQTDGTGVSNLGSDLAIRSHLVNVTRPFAALYVMVKS